MRKVIFVEMVPSNLRSRSKKLLALAEMYCNIWRFDENFQEYHQCPKCKKYYSFEAVTQRNVTHCARRHESAKLVEAWEVPSVAKYIRESMDNPGFSGFMAMDKSGTVLGFSWAYHMPIAKVRKNWGSEVVAKLKKPSRTVLYFSELGVLPEKRCRGHGNHLVRLVLEKAIGENSPKMTSLLRTHGDSHARTVFSTAGYKKFANDTMYGGGRILMSSAVGRLTPTNLQF